MRIWEGAVYAAARSSLRLIRMTSNHMTGSMIAPLATYWQRGFSPARCMPLASRRMISTPATQLAIQSSPPRRETPSPQHGDLRARRRTGCRCAHAGGQDHRADAAEQAPQRSLMAAQGEGTAAEDGSVHDEARPDAREDHEQCRAGQAGVEDRALTDCLEGCRQGGDGLGVGDDVDDALTDRAQADGTEDAGQLKQLLQLRAGHLLAFSAPAEASMY